MRKEIAFVIAFLGLLTWAYSPTAAVANELAVRPEAVILRGDQLSELRGVDLETLAVYSFTEQGGLRSVPFQVDEKFPGGEFIFLANRFPETHRLTPQDELVVMAREAGAKLKDPSGSLTSGILEEVEILDPLTGQRGWLYVGSEAIPPLRASYAGAVTPFNASHSWSVHGKVSFLNGAFSSDLDLASLDVRDVGEKLGPIRALRKIRVRPRLGYGVRMNPVTIVQARYDQLMTTEIRGDLAGMTMGAVSALELEIEDNMDGGSNASRVQIQSLVASGLDLQVVSNGNSGQGGEGGSVCTQCLRFRLSGPVQAGGVFHFQIVEFLHSEEANPEQMIRTLRNPLAIKTRVVSDRLASSSHR